MALTTDGATIATIKPARAHAQDHQRMNDQNYHHHDMKDVYLSQVIAIHHPNIMMAITITAHPTNIGIMQVVEQKSQSDFHLTAFEPLLGEYLSVQKQKDMTQMDDREVKGRWKSFIGKWNRNELAEGWYDPDTYARITAENPVTARPRRASVPKEEKEEPLKDTGNQGSEDEDDDYGPPLPGSDRARRSGPGIPTLQDLSLRAELVEEDKQASIEDIRNARKADRALQKERLDELVPRAEAGTRERMLEKKTAVADKMRSFRDKSPGAMEVTDEKELMGGGDSLDEYKKAKEREQRRKTEREIRREEIDRAKREEMEEKKRVYMEREEGTVSMLRELARQRFG
ncbi:hypothetical protein ACHAPD_004371 [Fusarium lateritium]